MVQLWFYCKSLNLAQEVEVQGDANISKLVELIYDEHADAFRRKNILKDDLKLFRLATPVKWRFMRENLEATLESLSENDVLDPTDDVQIAFPEPPPQHIHFVVRTFSSTSSSLSLYEIKSPQHPAYKQCHETWGKPLDQVFTRKPVDRSQLRTVPEESHPSHIWTFQAPQFLALDPSTLIVRGEYFRVYQYLVHESSPIACKAGFKPNLKGADADPFPESLDALHLPLVKGENTDWSKSFPPTSQERTKTKTIAVTGHPGIGKSIFSMFALLVCLSQKRSVMIQFQPRKIYIFTEGKAHKLNYNQFCKVSHSTEFNPSTHFWCLVDCNKHMQVVKSRFPTTFPFIVETVSYRNANLEWMKQYDQIHYFMASWNITELLVWRSVNPKLQEVNEIRLQRFFSAWGWSARTALQYRHSMNNYQKIVKEYITRTLVKSEGSSVLFTADPAEEATDSISHRILLPMEEDRLSCESRIITPFVLQLCLERLNKQCSYEVINFQNPFVEIPQMRSAGGVLFEQLFHRRVPGGGTWPAFEYKRVEGGKWQPTSQDPPSKKRRRTMTDLISKDNYIHIGRGEAAVTIDEAKEARTDKLNTVKYHSAHFLPNCQDGDYCHPHAKNQATFDAVIFADNRRTATIFQCTVGGSRGVKDDGLKWLKANGVTSVRYVLVKPNKMKAQDAVDIPMDFCTFVTEVYQMCFEFTVEDVLTVKIGESVEQTVPSNKGRYQCNDGRAFNSVTSAVVEAK